MKYVVCALYKFVALPDYKALREPIFNRLERLNIKGTLLLAAEGINGTISGTCECIEAFCAYLKEDARFIGIDYKFSEDDHLPFYRTKVKLKKEIVTLGIEGVDPTQQVGHYVKPKDWNALILDPEVLLVDTRNDYEVKIGTFKNAINPMTETFRDFPAYVEGAFDPKKHTKVAMFCTGGIRCEKSTAYMLQQGFKEVYHLEGGILKYLEEVSASDSLWEGECFVFDNRVSVNHDLKSGTYGQCFACRMPLSVEDQKHKYYQKGVSCHYCYVQTTEEDKRRFLERQKQNELAKLRGEMHIGRKIVV